MSSGAFQPMARTAKLSIPSLIFEPTDERLSAAAEMKGRVAAPAAVAASPCRKERRCIDRGGATEATSDGDVDTLSAGADSRGWGRRSRDHLERWAATHFSGARHRSSDRCHSGDAHRSHRTEHGDLPG